MATTKIQTQDMAVTGVSAGTYGSSTQSAQVTIGVDGRITAASTVSISSLTASNFVTEETPTGTPNGTLTTFSLVNTPTAGTQKVFKNGIRQRAGTGNDYTISGSTLTFLTGNVPQTNDIIVVDYQK